MKVNRTRKSRSLVSARWLFFLTLITILIAWNWQLLLATSLGIAMMVLLYRMQAWNWETVATEMRRLLAGPNRQLSLAVMGGGLFALGTYMAISVWIEVENGWVAASQILQSLGIVAILAFLVGRAIASPTQQQEIEMDGLLMDLTHPQPLRRLLAVRRVNRFIYTRHGKQERPVVLEALRLMYSREEEPAVRDAILDTVKGISGRSPLSQVPPSGSPLSIPLDLRSHSQLSVSATEETL